MVRNKGVTLVELLIAVSILAILAVIAMFAFGGQLAKGQDAKKKSDLERIKIALEEYEKDNNCYPAPGTITCNPGTALQPYLNKIPCDTKDISYDYQPENAICPKWYRMLTILETTKEQYKIESPNAPN